MRISDWSSDVCSSDLQTQWNPQPSLGVVMAAGGYPGAIRKGDVIRGLEADLGMAKVFHAGTTLRDDGAAITSGGRVLCVVARGADVREAQRQAYAAVEPIRWDGVQYRRASGYRAIALEASSRARAKRPPTRQYCRSPPFQRTRPLKGGR